MLAVESDLRAADALLLSSSSRLIAQHSFNVKPQGTPSYARAAFDLDGKGGGEITDFRTPP